MDFDPAEFESFKASSAPASGGFDPKEFESFKSGKKDAKGGFAWSDAITDIPSEIGREFMSGVKQVTGLADVAKTHAEEGQVAGMLKTAAAPLGVVKAALSPVTGTVKSIVGHTMANLEHAAGGVIAPDIAANDDPAKMYETAKSDVDTALAAAASRGGPRVAPTASAAPNEIAAASDRLAASGNPVEVPQAIASDSMIAQRTGQAVRNMPIIGDAIPKATARLGGQLEEATGNVASEFGGGSGPNVAHSIGDTIGSAAEREATAAKSAAQQSDAAVLADWERNVRGANDAVAGVESDTLNRARQAVGNMSPQDMGETLIARLRQGEREAHAAKERLYGVAGNSDGAIHAEAVRGLRADVTRSLDDQGLVVDPTLTPAAERMLAELDNTATLQMKRGPAPASEGRGAQQTNADSPQASPKTDISGKTADRGATRPSLLEFLAQKGLGPDAELEAIGGHSHTVNVEGVGRRKLVRQGGLPLDYAREAAEEAGYLRGNHNGTSTTNDLLDAINAEIRGQKRYPEGFEGTVSKRENVARSEREQHEYDQHIRGFENDLAAAGHGKLPADVKQRAIQLMADDRMSADTAVEHALRQLEHGDNAVYSASLRGAPVDMQVLEQTRKRLNAMSGAATNDADRRAARHVISAYDDWLANAFDRALFSGSDEALQSYRAARAANTEWRRRFGFDARDDADRIINKIVTGEVTPQEVSNYILGASKIGGKGVSSRLLTRLGEATGGDPEVMQAIRGGVWNRLSEATEGTAAKTSAKITTDINEFLNGSGRDVANRLFTEPQRAIMRTYADALQRGARAREAIAEVAANTKPSSMEVGIGPLQRLANDVLGKGGGRSDEALYSAINAYAKSGARGDIDTLSRVLRAIPEKDRGNLAGAMVRDMGVSPRTGQFSPDVFVSAWNTYKPEAKALLFGMSGPQRQALDDIATISQRMKEVGSKFGNPSGTAQNVNFFALASSFIAAPLTTLASGIGGAVVAKMLASPVGAVNVSRWSKAYERVAALPNLANREALKNASSMLAINVSRETGAPIKDLMLQLQGPSPAGAQDKKN